MLTKDGAIVRCSREAVVQTAEFLGGMQLYWEESRINQRHSVCYIDSQTGGGHVRLAWRNGICWISQHSGYAGDRTGEAFEVLTVLFDAVEIEREKYNWSPDEATYNDFCHGYGFEVEIRDAKVVKVAKPDPWQCRNFS